MSEVYFSVIVLNSLSFISRLHKTCNSRSFIKVFGRKLWLSWWWFVQRLLS